MTIVEIDITTTLLRDFMQNVLNCDYGVSNSLNQELIQYNKTIPELTEKEIEALSSKVFNHPPIFCLYNLKDAMGNLLLPNIYNDFLNGSENKELFSIGKYGIQCIDLFTKKGKLIFKDAYWIDFHTDYYVEIVEQSSRIKIFRYSAEKDDLEFLAEPREKIIGRLISFNESRFFFNGGFVDENFKATTPMCFDNGKLFSEGLAPTCLNGKWGYINKKSDIVIDFIYGNAEPFKNGKAKVFVLNSVFQNEKGVWIDSNLYDGYSQIEFSESFPYFDKVIRKPICIIRKNLKNSEELNKNYHFYAEGVNEEYGHWAEINSKGEIINSNLKNELKKIEPIDLELLPNADPDYWFNYIVENSSNYYIISELPDLLFIDKIFVTRILERFPNLFLFFSCLYSDDEDIAELVFNLSYLNFDFFSDRLRLVYQDRYNKKMTEEGQQLFDNNTTNQNLDDDLPL
jgi:hypothetical protein